MSSISFYLLLSPFYYLLKLSLEYSLKLPPHSSGKANAVLFLALNNSTVISAHVLQCGIALVGIVVTDERRVEEVLCLGEYAHTTFEFFLNTRVELYEGGVPTIVLVETLNHGNALARV